MGRDQCEKAEEKDKKHLPQRSQRTQKNSSFCVLTEQSLRSKYKDKEFSTSEKAEDSEIKRAEAGGMEGRNISAEERKWHA